MVDRFYVRQLAPSDASIVRALLFESNGCFPAIDDVVTALACAENSMHYGMFDGEAASLVGHGSLCWYRRAQGGLVGQLEDIYILRQFRGMGLASQLLKTIEREASALGCFKISAESSRIAEEFYRKLGYKHGGASMKKMIKFE